MQCYPEGLEERPRVVAQGIGQRMQEVARPEELLLEGAVEVAVPGEAHVGAQVAVPSPALLARVAGDGRVDGHPLAR